MRDVAPSHILNAGTIIQVSTEGSTNILKSVSIVKAGDIVKKTGECVS